MPLQHIQHLTTPAFTVCNSAADCLNSDDVLGWLCSPMGQVMVCLALIVCALLVSARLFAVREMS